MVKISKFLVLGAMALVLSFGQAHAVPKLQLDIGGGGYDFGTETVVTSSSVFTLYALLRPRGRVNINSTFYISIALTPKVSAPASYGSLDFDGTTINATSDMVYGTPPLEEGLAEHDGGDLGKHGIYDTYFKEYAFKFDASNRIRAYNTQDRAISGAPIDLTYASRGKTLYYAAFNVDISSLDPSVRPHFDLYTTYTRYGRGGKDIDILKFAPFSHDAEAVSVPEPSTAVLLLAGVTALWLFRTRRVS